MHNRRADSVADNTVLVPKIQEINDKLFLKKG